MSYAPKPKSSKGPNSVVSMALCAMTLWSALIIGSWQWAISYLAISVYIIAMSRFNNE